MSKTLGYERGLAKYVIKTPLTITGFISMYIFGGGVLSILNTLQHLTQTGSPLGAGITYFISKALPPTSIIQVLTQVIIGSVTAGALWYFSVK